MGQNVGAVVDASRGGPGRQASAVADLECGMSKDLIVRLIEVTRARSRIGQTARSCPRGLPTAYEACHTSWPPLPRSQPQRRTQAP